MKKSVSNLAFTKSRSEMTIVAKGIRYFREEGFRRGIERLYRETFGKLFLVMSSYIFEVPISDIDYSFKSKLDVNIKQLSAENALQLIGIAYDNLDTILMRLQEGDRCYVAEYGGKIISFVWTSYGNVYVPELEMSLQLADDEFYFYNGLTPPRFRRYGLQKAIIADLITFHRKMGYKKVFSSTSVKNKAGIGVIHKKFGGKKRMIVRLIKIFGISLKIY